MSIQTAPRCAWLVLVLGLLLLSGATVSAQVTGATLSGKVTDSSGAVVADARIVIEKMGTGVTREGMTNAEGPYSAPNLAPGTYEVSISAKGFSTQDRHGITLTVGGDQVIDAQLRVGQANETIVVHDEPPALQLKVVGGERRRRFEDGEGTAA